MLVTSTSEFGEVVRQQLLAAHGMGGDGTGSKSGGSDAHGQYVVDVDAAPTDEERAALQKK